MVWGPSAGLDAYGFQSQVVDYATISTITLTNQEIYSSITLHGLRMLFGFAQQLEMALFGLLAINAMGVKPRHKWALYTSVFLINASIMLLEGPFYLWPRSTTTTSRRWLDVHSPARDPGQSSYVIGPLWFLGWFALCRRRPDLGGVDVRPLRDWFGTGPQGAPVACPCRSLFILATVILSRSPTARSSFRPSGTSGSTTSDGGSTRSSTRSSSGCSGTGSSTSCSWSRRRLYLLIPLLAKRPIYSYRFAILAAVLFIILTPLLGIHHLYLTALPQWSTCTTMVISFLIIIPSAVTFFSLWMTLKGVRRSQWEWNIVALFTVLAFAGSIAGGLSGPDLATIGRTSISTTACSC